MSNAGASLATCYGPVSTHMMAKAENIRLLILDVDGVLSDGLIYNIISNQWVRRY